MKQALEIHSEETDFCYRLSNHNCLVFDFNLCTHDKLANCLSLTVYQNSQYILQDNIKISSEDSKLLDNSSKNIIKDFLAEFEKMSKIDKENLEKTVNGLINKHKTNFKGVGQPLRIALTGSRFGPGIYNIILSLKKDVIIERLKN